LNPFPPTYFTTPSMRFIPLLPRPPPYVPPPAYSRPFRPPLRWTLFSCRRIFLRHFCRWGFSLARFFMYAPVSPLYFPIGMPFRFFVMLFFWLFVPSWCRFSRARGTLKCHPSFLAFYLCVGHPHPSLVFLFCPVFLVKLIWFSSPIFLGPPLLIETFKAASKLGPAYPLLSGHFFINTW